MSVMTLIFAEDKAEVTQGSLVVPSSGSEMEESGTASGKSIMARLGSPRSSEIPCLRFSDLLRSSIIVARTTPLRLKGGRDLLPILVTP